MSDLGNTIAAGGLGATLLALALADLRSGILPDLLTLPLLLAGLAVSGWREGGVPTDAILGAVLGYGAFAGLAALYRRLRRRRPRPRRRQAAGGRRRLDRMGGAAVHRR